MSENAPFDGDSARGKLLNQNGKGGENSHISASIKSPSPASDAELPPLLDELAAQLEFLATGSATAEFKTSYAKVSAKLLETIRAAIASTRTASNTRTAAGEAECDAALGRAAPASQHDTEEAALGWMAMHGYGNQSFGYALADLHSRIGPSDRVALANVQISPGIPLSHELMRLREYDKAAIGASSIDGQLIGTPSPIKQGAEVDAEAERKLFSAEFSIPDGEAWKDYTKALFAGWIAKARAAARTQADAGKEREQYNELLYAVARKFPGESRHETALRYIRAAETPSTSPAKATIKPENT